MTMSNKLEMPQVLKVNGLAQVTQNVAD